MNCADLILALLDEAFETRTWHGPNLKQSIRGVSAKQAAWRPARGRNNIWELTLHAAYWKYTLRRKMEGSKRGSFVLKGSNFFTRPAPGHVLEKQWSADKAVLEREHRALRASAEKALQTRQAKNLLPKLWGVAFHDIYHAGQIRLLRRLAKKHRAHSAKAPVLR